MTQGDEPKTPPEAAESEPAKPEAAESEPAKPEAAESELAKSEAAESEPAKPEAAESEPAKSEAAKTEPATATAKSATAKESGGESAPEPEQAPRVKRPVLGLRENPGLLARAVLGAACVGVVFGLWQWASTTGESSYLVPPPLEVLGSLSTLFSERDLVSNVFISLRRVIFGFGLAVLIGVPLGIAAASYRQIAAFLAPIVTFFRNTPMATLVPLTMVVFALSEKQKVSFIFIATFAFVLSDTVASVMTIPQRYIETAQTVGASRRQIILKVLTPLALPDITTSIRFLFGLGFGYIILAEMLDLSSGGLGAMIIVSMRRAKYEEMYMIVFVIVVLAFLIDKCLHFFQRGIFPYRKDL